MNKLRAADSVEAAILAALGLLGRGGAASSTSGDDNKGSHGGFNTGESEAGRTPDSGATPNSKGPT